MMKVLIVDDEPIARRRLRRLLRHEPDVQVVGECGDGVGAVDAIHTLRPDVVLLDIQMPEFDGFDVINALGDDVPAVVFVTAYDEHALRAFEVNALHYLLKPIARGPLVRALDRARAMRWRRASGAEQARALEPISSERRYLKRLPVRVGERVIVVDVAEVEWISAADNYVTLHSGRREWLVRGTMTWLGRVLDPATFVRIHRGTIVRLTSIAELISASHGDMTMRLKDGTELAVSRQYRPRLEASLRG